MSLPFLPIASERSPSRRPRECRAPPPTRGVPTKTQAASSNHLGSNVLAHPAPQVARMARSPGLCSGGHGHPLAVRTVSQVLGPVVQLSSPATRHESRTHLGLAKQCPIPRPVSSRGRIIEIPQLGGLH